MGELYDKDRDQQLWQKYRLTLECFKSIFKAQGERCGCCATTTPGEGTWCVDHDHRTDQVRGILCSGCNTGLGQLGDSISGLERALAYLRAHEDRGGYPQAATAPTPIKTRPKISERMRKCFELFKQGVPRNKVVIITRLTPEAVEEIHTLWCNRDGDVVEVDRHIFQLGKDPLRCMCCCGFAIECSPNDPDTILQATETVNEHIKTANADHESHWLALKLEEEARRSAEAQQERDRRRAQAMEDIQRRSEQRKRYRSPG